MSRDKVGRSFTLHTISGKVSFHYARWRTPQFMRIAQGPDIVLNLAIAFRISARMTWKHVDVVRGK